MRSCSTAPAVSSLAGVDPPQPISVTFIPATVFDNPAITLLRARRTRRVGRNPNPSSTPGPGHLRLPSNRIAADPDSEIPLPIELVALDGAGSVNLEFWLRRSNGAGFGAII